MISDFHRRLRLFPVSVVIERIGCKQSAVYAWQSGFRTPEPWQQSMILEKLGEPPAPTPASGGAPETPGRGRPRKVYPIEAG